MAELKVVQYYCAHCGCSVRPRDVRSWQDWDYAHQCGFFMREVVRLTTRVRMFMRLARAIEGLRQP